MMVIDVQSVASTLWRATADRTHVALRRNHLLVFVPCDAVFPLDVLLAGSLRHCWVVGTRAPILLAVLLSQLFAVLLSPRASRRQPVGRNERLIARLATRERSASRPWRREGALAITANNRRTFLQPALGLLTFEAALSVAIAPEWSTALRAKSFRHAVILADYAY
jgi:hypothetical protein